MYVVRHSVEVLVGERSQRVWSLREVPCQYKIFTGSVTEKNQPEIYVIDHSQALSPKPDLERCNTFHSYRDRKLWNLCLAGGL